MGVAEALEAFAISESLGEGLAEGEEGVFGCVVVVDYFEKKELILRKGIGWLGRVFQFSRNFNHRRAMFIIQLEVQSQLNNLLAKSPKVLTRRLHPACFASACNM